MDILHSIFFFVIALGVLISIHEYGHFWVARRCGVKVLKFSVGFGRPLWRKTGADGVEYVLAMIPLGGFVKMLDETEGDVLPEERDRAFNRQPVGKRFMIALAGPVANFILAILLYTFAFSVGVDGIKPVIGSVETGSLAEKSGLRSRDEILAINNQSTRSWQTAMFSLLDASMNQGAANLTVKDETGKIVYATVDFSTSVADSDGPIDVFKQLGIRPYYPTIPAVVGEVQEGKAARRAGLQTGDAIIALNGAPVTSWSDWVKKVRAHPEESITVSVKRQGNVLQLEMTPERVSDKGGAFGFVGVAPDVSAVRPLLQAMHVKVSYPVPVALWKATEKTWDMSLLTLQVLGKILVGEASVSNLSGPISIAQYAGDTANAGLVSFLMFLAVISVSLGVLNLLPIPMLDGGHLFYYLIEFVQGKPVPDWVQGIGLRVGVFILVCLMSIAFYNDILRLLGEG